MRVANKDTYGIERVPTVGDEEAIEIRRKVVAGQTIPDHLDVDAEDYEEREGTLPRGYKADQILGTKESTEKLESGALGTADQANPGSTAAKESKGRGRRPAKTGAAEAADAYNRDEEPRAQGRHDQRNKLREDEEDKPSPRGRRAKPQSTTESTEEEDE